MFVLFYRRALPAGLHCGRRTGGCTHYTALPPIRSYSAVTVFSGPDCTASAFSPGGEKKEEGGGGRACVPALPAPCYNAFLPRGGLDLIPSCLCLPALMPATACLCAEEGDGRRLGHCHASLGLWRDGSEKQDCLPGACNCLHVPWTGFWEEGRRKPETGGRRKRQTSEKEGWKNSFWWGETGASSGKKEGRRGMAKGMWWS